jgi:hypothetical protein
MKKYRSIEEVLSSTEAHMVGDGLKSLIIYQVEKVLVKE